MTMQLDSERVPQSTKRTIRGQRVAKLLVVDPEPLRGATVARALGSEHMVLNAREPTLALAICVRDRPDLVVASVDLITMQVSQLAALIDYARHGQSPPIIAFDDDEPVSPPIVAVVPDADPEAIRGAVETFLSQIGARL